MDHLDSLSSSQTNLCPDSSRHQLYCTSCSIRAIKVLLVSVLSPHWESDMEGILKVAHYLANMVRTSALATCKNYATDMSMVMRHGSHSSNAWTMIWVTSVQKSWVLHAVSKEWYGFIISIQSFLYYLPMGYSWKARKTILPCEGLYGGRYSYRVACKIRTAYRLAWSEVRYHGIYLLSTY